MKKNYLNFKKVALALSLTALFGAADMNAQCVITATSSATSVCLGNTVSITASGATTYTLSNGAANGSAFVPTSTGSITYTVDGSGSCGTGSATITINVNPLPTATVSASSPTLCSGSTTTLTVTGNAASYTWAVTGNSTTAAITVTPPAAPTGTIGTTNYVVNFTSAQGCTASAAYVVTVVTTPVIAPIATPPQICSGGTTTLQTSGAASYTWMPGGANTSSIIITPATVTAVTAVVYTVTKSNGSCVNVQSVAVTVNPLPVIFALATPTIVCAGNQATLTAGGTTNFTWSPGTSPVTGANVIITPTANTVYTFTGSNSTCSSVSTITVPVNPIPTLAVSASPTAICVGNSAVLSATGALTYTWTTFTSTVALYGQQVTVSPTAGVTYYVDGQNSFGCIGSSSQNLIVNNLPSINVSFSPASSTIICLGKSATLTASGNSQSYLWDGNANNATTPVVVVSPTITTAYIVGGTNSFGCTNTKITTVTVFTPSVTIPTSTSICRTSTITLGSSGANTYTWLPGNAHTPSITVSPTVNTTYSISVSSTVQNGPSPLSCRADYTLQLNVNPNPTVTTAASSTVICRGESATLTAAGATNYTWTPTPASGATGSMVTVNSTDAPNYINSTTYTVTGSFATNCKSKDVITVFTSGCVGIESISGVNHDVTVYPNPNNGEFNIKSNENITLSLRNQLGQEIKTITLSDSNNHTAMISDVASGIYFVVGSNENGRVSQKIIINK